MKFACAGKQLISPYLGNIAGQTFQDLNIRCFYLCAIVNSFTWANRGEKEF